MPCLPAGCRLFLWPLGVAKRPEEEKEKNIAPSLRLGLLRKEGKEGTKPTGLAATAGWASLVMSHDSALALLGCSAGGRGRAAGFRVSISMSIGGESTCSL